MSIVVSARSWAFTVLGFTLLVVTVLALSVEGSLRALIVLIWVAVCPGIGVARRLGGLDGLPLVVVGVALSLVMAQVVTAALMYLQVYSWQVVFAVLATVTLACIAPDMRPTRGARGDYEQFYVPALWFAVGTALGIFLMLLVFVA